MTLYKWSQIPGNDATADSTINWSEGQVPSSINDSARAMMAATAKYRDDIAGAIVTAGTSTAYTVTSYEVFDTLAHLNGQMVAFSPHATNGATVTLNVDGLGAKPLRTAPNAELLAGVLVQGTPYIATYNNSDGAFYLKGFYGNPYNIPLAATIDYWAATAPNSSFVFPFGQAISRTTYAALFALIGMTYGSGDGSTTFNIPDLRGRTIASPDTMGGGDPNRLTAGAMAIVRGTLGGAGGESAHTLTTAEMPVHSHGVTDLGHSHNITNAYIPGVNVNAVGGNFAHQGNMSTDSAVTGISIQNSGSGGAHNLMQPTILANRIMRII